jgi:N-acetylglucosamine-6-phosphate deacetylase
MGEAKEKKLAEITALMKKACDLKLTDAAWVACFTPEEIAIMTCVNPARAAGVTDRGELKTGMRADIIILDKEFNVIAVFQKGERIK